MMASDESELAGSSTQRSQLAIKKTSTLNALRQCDDHIISLNDLVASNRKELMWLENLTKKLEDKMVTMQAEQPTLQEKILQMTKTIDESESKCFSIKIKLPFLSRQSIQDSISRLEAQLRYHNYRPRDEALVLREISKLRNSLPLLQEYRTLLQQNRQYRLSKQALVEKRNANHTKLQQAKHNIEKEIVKIQKIRDVLQENIIGLEEVQRQKDSLLQIAKERLLKHQQQRESKIDRNVKAVEDLQLSTSGVKYQQPKIQAGFPRDAYATKLKACGMLLAYIKTLASAISKRCSSAIKSEENNSDNGKGCSEPGVASALDPGLEEVEKDIASRCSTPCPGEFYYKTRNVRDKSNIKIKKRSRKSRKNQKEISHPPDVIATFIELEITVPKKIDDIPVAAKAVEHKLNYFQLLNEQVYFEKVMGVKCSVSQISLKEAHSPCNKTRIFPSVDNEKCNILTNPDNTTLLNSRECISCINWQSPLPSAPTVTSPTRFKSYSEAAKCKSQNSFGASSNLQMTPFRVPDVSKTVASSIVVYSEPIPHTPSTAAPLLSRSRQCDSACVRVAAMPVEPISECKGHQVSTSAVKPITVRKSRQVTSCDAKLTLDGEHLPVTTSDVRPKCYSDVHEPPVNCTPNSDTESGMGDDAEEEHTCTELCSRDCIRSCCVMRNKSNKEFCNNRSHDLRNCKESILPEIAGYEKASSDNTIVSLSDRGSTSTCFVTESDLNSSTSSGCSSNYCNVQDQESLLKLGGSERVDTVTSFSSSADFISGDDAHCLKCHGIHSTQIVQPASAADSCPGNRNTADPVTVGSGSSSLKMHGVCSQLNRYLHFVREEQPNLDQNVAVVVLETTLDNVHSKENLEPKVVTNNLVIYQTSVSNKSEIVSVITESSNSICEANAISSNVTTSKKALKRTNKAVTTSVIVDSCASSAETFALSRACSVPLLRCNGPLAPISNSTVMSYADIAKKNT